MALKNKMKVLLWFHGTGLTQATVAAINAKYPTMDVRFRLVVRNPHRDILEDFDAVGGDVPVRYLEAAQTKGLEVYTDEVDATTTTTTVGSSQTTTTGSEGTSGTEAKAAAAPVAPPKPADAPKAAPAPIAPPPAT